MPNKRPPLVNLSIFSQTFPPNLFETTLLICINSKLRNFFCIKVLDHDKLILCFMFIKLKALKSLSSIIKRILEFVHSFP